MTRIVSFLPSATEMVFALGLGDQLVGVSHECDYPEEAKTKPVVVRPAMDVEHMTLGEIDVKVAERIGSGGNLYQVDEALLSRLNPDLVLIQNLCEVCGPAGNEMTQVLKALAQKPHVEWLTPRSLDEIMQNLRDVGAATGRKSQAETMIATWRARLDKIAAATRSLAHRPRVFCMEWIDPIYCSGHWVPEMVAIAGGQDQLGRKGTDSIRVSKEQVLEWDPEILIVSPCGFHTEAAAQQTEKLLSDPVWKTLSAVRNGKVYAVDASSYFARPGPRVIEGTELLAHLIHPELFAWNGPSDAYRKLPA